MRPIDLSEVVAETVRRAHAVHPIVDVQLEYSLISPGLEQKLSRDLLFGSKPHGGGDSRAHMRRFSWENSEQNQRLVAALGAIASKRRVSPVQLAIAWVLSRGEDIVPVVGARTRAQLTDSFGALDLSLSPVEAAELEAAVPPPAWRAPRYDARQM